jgi:hypothetical protein
MVSRYAIRFLHARSVNVIKSGRNVTYYMSVFFGKLLEYMLLKSPPIPETLVGIA